MEEDTSGFYKNLSEEDGGLQWSINSVRSRLFYICRELKDTYQYPVYGWYWFDSIQLARQFFGLPEPESQPE